jgi:hypothetical protein
MRVLMSFCILFVLLMVVASAQTAGNAPKAVTDSEIQSLRSTMHIASELAFFLRCR